MPQPDEVVVFARVHALHAAVQQVLAGNMTMGDTTELATEYEQWILRDH